MENIFPSKSGMLTATIRDRQLHSIYDPQREADRYTEEKLSSTGGGTVLLLGAGLGYLYNSIKKLRPESRVIELRYSTVLWNRSRHPGPVWHPEAGISPYAFLKKNLDESDLKGLTILEWPASAENHQELSRTIHENIHEIITALNGNIVTTGHFGKRWIKNIFANYLHIDRYTGRIAMEGPICIVAPGASIEDDLYLLRVHREKINIIALPSSLSALYEADIQPDMIISTDPGYWAFCHLALLKGQKPVPVAMPLTAARGVWKTPSTVWLFSQGSAVENMFAGDRDYLPSNGTVAGSALEFVVRNGRGPVIFMGLDLCTRDLKSHARPGTFDALREQGGNRVSPVYSDSYKRMLESSSPGSVPGIRISKPLAAYASWFNRACTSAGCPLYRYKPSPIKIDGFIEIDEKNFEKLLGRNVSIHTSSGEADTYAKRRNKILFSLQHLRTLVQSWIDGETYSPHVKELHFFIDTPGYLEYMQTISSGQSRDTRELRRDYGIVVEEFLSGLETSLEAV